MHLNYPIALDHLEALFSCMKDFYSDDAPWASAVPNFPSGRNQFGILFPDRATAVQFSDLVRQRPFSYQPPDDDNLGRPAPLPRGIAQGLPEFEGLCFS